MKLLARALVAGPALMGAETLHGILRGWFLVPRVGDFRARQIGAAVGSVIIVAPAYGLIPWMGAKSTKALSAIGGLLGLTLAFELTLGRLVLRFPWERVREDYDLLHGGLLLPGMAILPMAPRIAARLRRVNNSQIR